MYSAWFLTRHCHDGWPSESVIVSVYNGVIYGIEIHKTA